MGNNKVRGERHRGGSQTVRILAPLAAAVICTGLIAEAIVTAWNGRSNGDLMVLVCPILGATFLSIPAAQAWWAVLKIAGGK